MNVLVDGKVVAKEFYDAKSGSTEVTLKAAYLETLSVGEHSLTIVSTDGEASTKFTILPKADPSPETGDRSYVGLWGSIMAVALVSTTACIFAIRKKKKA